MTDSLGRGAGVAIAIATGVVIVAVSLVPFLNPIWIAFEQGRAGSGELTGYSPDQLRQATDGIVADLVFGPPAFDVAIGGEPVLNERERGHMRDVRSVFAGFGALALGSVAIVTGGWLAARRSAPRREGFRRAVRAGATGLALGVAGAGVVSVVAFDAMFELFHRIFFSGNYTFDPRSERLVQLFPLRFWSETAVAVGVVILVVALGVRVAARPRATTRAASAVPMEAAG